jgi:hypothetical protein
MVRPGAVRLTFTPGGCTHLGYGHARSKPLLLLLLQPLHLLLRRQALCSLPLIPPLPLHCSVQPLQLLPVHTDSGGLSHVLPEAAAIDPMEPPYPLQWHAAILPPSMWLPEASR